MSSGNTRVTLGIHRNPCADGALLICQERRVALHQVSENILELSVRPYGFVDGVYKRRLGCHHDSVIQSDDVVLEFQDT